MSVKIIDQFSDIPDRRKRARLRARAKGLCWCGKVPEPGKKSCSHCIARAKAHETKKAAEYANE